VLYEFTLILSGSPGLTEEAAERLFDAGCADGTLGTCNGVLSIDSQMSLFTSTWNRSQAAVRLEIVIVWPSVSVDLFCQAASPANTSPLA
jgi:hypothetical protein